MNAIVIFIKYCYTMIVSISYYNEAIQISGNTIWPIQLTPTRSLCTKFPYTMTIRVKVYMQLLP